MTSNAAMTAKTMRTVSEARGFMVVLVIANSSTELSKPPIRMRAAAA